MKTRIEVSSYTLDNAWYEILKHLKKAYISDIVCLIVEEIISNIYKHSIRVIDQEINIYIELDTNKIVIVADNVEDFDFYNSIKSSIHKVKSYNLSDFGGIGLHLVNSLVEDKKYFYTEGRQHYEFKL